MPSNGVARFRNTVLFYGSVRRRAEDSTLRLLSFDSALRLFSFEIAAAKTDHRLRNTQT